QGQAKSGQREEVGRAVLCPPPPGKTRRPLLPFAYGRVWPSVTRIDLNLVSVCGFAPPQGRTCYFAPWSTHARINATCSVVSGLAGGPIGGLGPPGALASPSP